MEILSVFSRNMKKYRKKANLTQEKLAELCETDHRYIGQIETGNRCPSLEYVERIANALNVAPYLLFYEGINTDGETIINLTGGQKQKLKEILFDNYSQMCILLDEVK